MLEVIVKAVLWLLGKISNIILLPISALITGVFQAMGVDITTWFTSVSDFLDNYIFNNLLFAKQVAVNFGVPQIIFTFIITYYTFLLLMWAGGKIYLLAHNIYRTFKP